MTPLRIVSLNAWGGACWPALSAWLPTLKADVLCLQEMIRAPQPSPDWLQYRDAYRDLSQRADLYLDVSALLPTHQARFAAASRGYLMDGQGRGHLSEHGLGQWIAPQLAVTSVWQGFAHGAFRADGWGLEPVPRAAQVARLATPDCRALVVAHLHGLRDPSGKGDTPARAAQWRAMVEAIRHVAEADDPVILCGDLNVLPDSEAFGIFGAIGLTDLVTSRGHTDTRTSLHEKPQRHANYLLVNDHVRVAEFDVPATPEVSDHRPLILDCVV